MGTTKQGFNSTATTSTPATPPAAKPFDYYANLSDLHATQLRVGYTEIEAKRREFDAKDDEGKLQAYLEEKPVLVVLGPPGITDTKPFPSLPQMADDINKTTKSTHARHKSTRVKHPFPKANFDTSKATLFVVDHHHESLGLMTASHDFTDAPIKIVHDYSAMTPAQFWAQMKQDNLLNMNNNGPANSFNDPYRSLVRFVRKAGGFEKAEALYEEFQWADFFRDKIDVKQLDQLDKAVKQGNDWTKTDVIKKAVALAQSDAAKNLPGYTGKPAPAAVPQTAPVAAKTASKVSKKEIKAVSKLAAKNPWLIV